MFTNTQVRRVFCPSRMARSTSVAATDGIDASRERADGASTAHGLADIRDGGVDEMLWGPGRFGAADDKREVFQDVGAVLRVVNFRMKLHRPHFLFGILNRGDRVRRTGAQPKSLGQLDRFVAVRHPDGKFFRQTVEEARSLL